MTRWRLQAARSAEKDLSRLPEKVVVAIVEFVTGPLVENPNRVGKRLQRELEGYMAARRGAYRVIYRLEARSRVIRVVRIEHRADVYRQRQMG